MAYWKQIDLSLKFCRMCLIQKRVLVEDLLHKESESESEKLEKACDKIVTKFAKDIKISEEYFKELLMKDINNIPEEIFIEEFEELFGEEYEDILQSYINQ